MSDMGRTIASNIRASLDERRMSVAELAKRADIPPTTLRRYLVDSGPMGLGRMECVAAALDVRLSELLNPLPTHPADQLPHITSWHPFADHAWTGYSTPALERKIAWLHGYAVSLGLDVVVVSYTHPEKDRMRFGDYSRNLGVITLNERLCGYQVVGTLAHEIAHAFHRDGVRPGEFEDPAIEVRADRAAVALVVPEDVFLDRFDPERHLYTSPGRNLREVVDLFACCFRPIRRRYELGPSV